MPVRPISNSEVTSWLQCTQKWWYEFILKIEPKTLSAPLTYGNIMHDGFQFYAEKRLEGASHKKALTVTDEEYFTPLIKSGNNLEIVLHCHDIWRRYHTYQQGWPDWKILGAEQRHDLKITDAYSLPIRYDLLVEEISSGRKALVDYKLTYDFWPPEAHELNVQFPKYISVLNAAGIDVQGAYLEELRYRKMKDMRFEMHFKRTPYFPPIAVRRNALKQHIKASKQIDRWYELPKEEQEEEIVPILARHICKLCDFKNLCIGALNGGDVAYTIQTQYQDKSYGYDELPEEEEATKQL